MSVHSVSGTEVNPSHRALCTVRDHPTYQVRHASCEISAGSLFESPNIYFLRKEVGVPVQTCILFLKKVFNCQPCASEMEFCNYIVVTGDTYCILYVDLFLLLIGLSFLVFQFISALLTFRPAILTLTS